MLQPLESELCYANLTLTQTGASPRSSRRKSSTKLCPSAQEGKTGVEYVTMVCAWWGCCGAQSQTCPCPLSHPCGHRAGWAPGKVAPIGRLACSVSPGFWPLEVSLNQVSALGTQSLVKHGPWAGQGRPRQADDLGLHAESAAWRGV